MASLNLRPSIFQRRSVLLCVTLGYFCAGCYAQNEAQVQYGEPEGCGLEKQPAKFCPTQWLKTDWSTVQSFNWNANPNNRQNGYKLDEPQDTPCKSVPATCSGPTVYSCATGMQKLSQFTAGSNVIRELKPGSPAVCAHGNREFSFLARRGKSITKAIVVFMGGGICWDAASCAAQGGGRTISLDSLYSKRPDISPAVPFEIKEALGTGGQAFRLGIFDSTSTEMDNPFTQWSLVAIPDCTGDQHTGNRSYTYDPGKDETCQTVHHHGGVNTGLAMDWFFESFPKLEQVLILGTTLNEKSKATGTEGAVFWAKYIQDRAPSAKVRVIVDSSLAIFGPNWRQVMKDDPWGTANLAKTPPSVSNSGGGIVAQKQNSALVLPPRNEWAIGQDDMLSYYQWAAQKSPQLVFVEVSSIDDDVQIAQFEMLGGRQRECCMDGCSCKEGPSGDQLYYGFPNQVIAGVWQPWQHTTASPSIHPPAPSTESVDARKGMGLAGSLDWTKTRKIAVLRKHRQLEHNYRAFLVAGNRRGLLSQNDAFRTACPYFKPGQSQCYTDFVLRKWVKGIADSVILLDGLGNIANSSLVDADDYTKRVFGQSTCRACLDGILGAQSMREELCNTTLPPGASYLTVAPRFDTTWLALWSINSGLAPDMTPEGHIFRFAHEMHLLPGDSIKDIATRMGTTVERILSSNYNRLTHVHNHERPGKNAVLCVVPSFFKSKDRMGQGICDKADKSTMS